MKKIIIFVLQIPLIIFFYTANASVSVLKNYADIAEAVYEDSLYTAKILKEAIDEFTREPSEYNLNRAKEAWLAARVPYQQSEVYRFGNSLVDDWEGKVNAWPLDEGLIDYVDKTSYGSQSDENGNYNSNVVANKNIKINGKNVSTSSITKDLISEKLHEAGGVESNVATGYHAIEFLLWGQDLNGTKNGAGMRRATDFSKVNCTNGNCNRRIQYLKVATDLLIDDLQEMVSKWRDNGAARKIIIDGGINKGLTAIITGLGSLSYGELAGERIQLGLMLHDPEEEHDCFSDNTHNSHYYDQIGMMNVYTGKYVGVNGKIISGPSIGDLIKRKNAGLHNEMLGKLSATLLSMNNMKKTAEAGKSYDQMLAVGDKHGNEIIQDVVDHLKDQTVSIEKIVATLDLNKIEFEGSDSLDNPKKVFE